MSRYGSSEKNSTRTSRTKPTLVGQSDIFGGVEGLEKLVDPEPKVIERDGIRVVGVVIPASKMGLPGYIPEALKQARALVPEVQTSGKPPWMSAKWQAQSRKRKATYG